MKLRVIEDGNGHFKVETFDYWPRGITGKGWQYVASFPKESDAIRHAESLIEQTRELARSREIKRVLREFDSDD
jgi:hypothetical protein